MGPQREVSDELKEVIFRELPDNVAHKVFDFIYNPCDLELICTYIEKLDDLPYDDGDGSSLGE